VIYKTNDCNEGTHLLKNIAMGSESSFHELYNLYRNKIYSVAFKVTKSSAIAEDVIQEIFIVIWLKREELHKVENFDAWLNTVLKNHLYNRFRKLAIEGTYVKYVLENSRQQLPDHMHDPAVLAEVNKIFHEALERLTPQQRKVYLLGKQSGLKYEEIAEQVGISRHTVKEYMSNAMRSMKDYMISRDYSLVALIILMTLNKK